MRAQLIFEHGGPEQLELRDFPKPSAVPGQLLIRIHASSVNPIDIKIREGLSVGPELPAVLGADLAGVVEAVGEGVEEFRAGDEVYGCAGGVKGLGGTLAEYIAADARLIARKPECLSFREAAALPLVSITAWQAIERLVVRPGERILVHGGTGGVGHIGVQLARNAGAHVVATVGSEEAPVVVRKLGAADVVDYRQEDVASYVERLTGGEGFSAIFDTVGGANLVRSFEAAAIGGRIATTNARTVANLETMHGKALSLHVVFMLLPLLRGAGREGHGAILRRVAQAVDAGKLRPLLDPVPFKLESAGAAQAHLASGAACGKVVVDIP
ncbi:MAG: zinc-dependent alcohol dehydrogenase family protein [Sphingobium sp.]